MEINRTHPAFQLTPAQRARLGLDKAPAAQALPTGHVKQADGSITLEPAAHALVCAALEPHEGPAEQVARFLATCGVTMEWRYLGEQKERASGAWPDDAYKVTFRRGDRCIVVPFGQGIGHRKEGKAVAPAAADVLDSLLLDADAAQADFEDWAEEFDIPMSTKEQRKEARDMHARGRQAGRDLAALFNAQERDRISDLLANY